MSRAGRSRYASFAFWHDRALPEIFSHRPFPLSTRTLAFASSPPPSTTTSDLLSTSPLALFNDTRMATPSSSATSPSPPMAYLHQPPAPQPASSIPLDPLEREHRKKAVQKFLARAEISMVTRALRARLSYASYKAAHNIPHVPLRDLEAQTQTQTQNASFSRTIAAKRKTAGVNNYYNNPASQGSAGTGTGSLRRRGSGIMAPPTTLNPRSTYYPGGAGTASTASGNMNIGNSIRNANATQSLYTSILAPPPVKQARTIHNASDPPIPAPSRPTSSPRARIGQPLVRSIAEGTRAQAKSRRNDKSSGGASPDKRKRKRADKGKQKQKGGADEPDIDADGDVDMKAAAALTSLLLHHRPSIAGSASSPRSSIDSAETGSTHSYSHFAQSSARTTTASAPTSSGASTSTIAEPSFRDNTPPPITDGNVQHTTPRPAPTDNEAADLMLFLATSPSPARPSNKDAKDQAAYRVLGGGGGALRAKGRVLFPTAVGGDGISEDGGSGRGMALALARSGESSFTSSISSIGSEMGLRGASSGTITDGTPPRSTLVPTPAQLLPPPPLPLPTSTPPSPSMMRRDQNLNSTPSPKTNYPGAVEFNFNDFINASPSPARGTVGQGQKSNLGLRADVGRKLFEEEQIRLGFGGQGKRSEERGLGEGIDLLQS